MTKGGMWKPSAQNYLGYKGALSRALAEAYPHLVIPECPRACTKKANPEQFAARKAWEKTYKGRTYTLLIHANTHSLTSDGDNIVKTVADALQDARIIHNDNEIKKGAQRIENSKDEPEHVTIVYLDLEQFQADSRLLAGLADLFSPDPF
jgi:hypothetical protein